MTGDDLTTTGDGAAELVAKLTLDEQILLLSGRDFWHTNPVERLAIGAVHLSDGPVGVRGERTVGTTSVSFPCGAAIGATFDPQAAAALADALADECADKHVHVLLGPTINLQRHPIGGRHFECYSEDPVLTAELAVAYVTALQARGVAATVKHYVANDTEFQRHTISSEVDERVLELCYLAPFEDTIRRAAPLAIMASYNRINGTYAAEHAHLLEEVLRQRWGYDGLVMSDWFGTQSTEPSALAGLDLEMPGPAVHYGARLAEAVERGDVSRAVVAERARRVVQLAARVGALDGQGHPAERRPRRNLGERRELARQLAAQSFVLLRNEPPSPDGDASPILPLDLRPGALLAVIGPNAATTTAQGGGSARVLPVRTLSVRDGLRELYGPVGVDVEHEIGCVTWAETPDLDVPVHLEYFVLAAEDAEQGVSFDGPVVHEEDSPRSPLLWMGDPIPSVAELRYGAFAVRCTADFTPELSGTYELSLAQVGSARLLLDGRVVVEGSREQGKRFYGFGSEEASGRIELEAGTTYQVVAEYEVATGSPLAGLFIGVRPPLPSEDDLIARAAELAGRADTVVCVVGTTAEWETEGHDRATMDLPGRQDDLVRAVVAANPRTVVLVNAGSPVTMDWAELPAATIQIWFGGETIGRAVADVLSGADEPGGRLPHTIPVRLEDTPAFPYYPGADGRTVYGEGLLVGHRHYATKAVLPRYWFGHGLSYTTFSFADGRAEAVRATATVTNTGDRQGTAVLQAYLAPQERADGEPALQFAGSARHTIAASDSLAAEIGFGEAQLARLRPGAYDVLLGWSAEPAGLTTVGTITAGA